jgi:alpha-tubulin suppressor-like RCC1 family protein
MSGSQMSGSFASNGKHVISVGEDSRVYIWNFNDSGNYFPNREKTEFLRVLSFQGGYRRNTLVTQE